jgi:uncharacterized protein
MSEADDRLRAVFATLPQGGVVALSGGVDSALVLAAAREAWGRDRVVAATSRSESVPDEEIDAAAALAASLDVEHVVVEGRELDVAGYRQNDSDRCFFCKDHLYARLARLAEARGLPQVLDGANADDTGDHRPGMRAARQHGVVSPLLLAGIGKSRVRTLSKARGLETWDKPAEPCLSSRIPYGTLVTEEGLDQVLRGERLLKSLGFPVVRLRLHAPVARIEVPADQASRLFDAETRTQVLEGIKALGFTYVAIDLEGFRSGSLNE